MKNNRLRILTKSLLAILFLLNLNVSADQINTGSRYHNTGTLKWRVDTQFHLDTSGNDFTPIATWPNGVYDTENCQFWWFMILPDYWYDVENPEAEIPDTTFHTKERNIWASLGGESNMGYPWGIYEYRRYAPPVVDVNGHDDTFNFLGEVDENILSDVYTQLKVKTGPGFYLTLKTYSFANQYHDDYVINHLNIEYTGNTSWDNDDTLTIPVQDLEDVWFSLGYHMVPSFAGQKEITGSRWGGEAYDDWMDWEYVDPLVSSGIDENRDEMLMVYAWDGDDTDITEVEAGGQYFNDTGDPSFLKDEKGQFLSYQYPGYTVLHADTSPSDDTDDPDQPQTLALASIFDVWAGSYGGQMDYDYFSSGNKVQIPDPWDPGNSHWMKSDHMFMGLGPYDFTLGEDIDLIWSVGVGGVDWDSTYVKGTEWLDWYRGGESTFDDDAKRDFLSQGKDSLLTVLSRSRWAWDKIRNGQNIPAPLPAPDLYVTDGGGFIKLEWQDMSTVPDPVTGVPDLDFYRVYRKLGAYLVNFKDDEFGKGINYELLVEVDGNVTEYFDTTAVRGESYRYFVTAVDDGSQNFNGLFPGMPLESSHFLNRTKSAATSFKPAPSHVDSVRIVPNPYVISGGALNFTGDNNRILFVNLPAYCTIKIFNTTGDLIRTMKHTSGSGDEAWDLLSESKQRVVSGVYILHLSDCETLDGDSLNDVIEKFVIIR